MKKGSAVLLLALLGLVSGCTTLPHRVDVRYQPSTTPTGSGGQIYLASGKGAGSGNQDQLRWVVGEIRKPDGTPIDDIVAPLSPRDQVGDALRRELEQAGYQVLLGEAKPEEVSGPYLRVTEARLTMTEVPSWFQITSTAQVFARVELWRSGKLVATEGYDSGYEENYSRTQPDKVQEVRQKALTGVMDKAIPDIVRNLGPQKGEKR